MLHKIVMFINLVAYSFVVSQGFMYFLALRNVTLNMTAPAFIELRKLIDKNFDVKYRLVIYASCCSCLGLTLLTGLSANSLLFSTSLFALMALIADITVALKANIPINKIINSWSVSDYPPDWQWYRNRWLAFFQYRQWLSFAGFLSLLTGAVFG